MNKALNMCFYKRLKVMSLLNGEVAIFRSLTPSDIMDCARATFEPRRSSALLYIEQNEQ